MNTFSVSSWLLYIHHTVFALSFHGKANMKLALRHLPRASTFIASIGFSILALAPFQSVQAATCCNCHPNGNATINICLTDGAATCTDIITKSKNPALADFTCDSSPLDSTTTCKPISSGDASAKCTQGPTDATGYTSDASKNGASPLTKVEPIIPALGVDINGIKFSNNLVEKDGDVYIPFLGEYIAGVYKYLIGITVISAALMMIYGGFLWIIGASITSITKGKKIITDAVIGLVLVFGTYTILNMLNPATVTLQTLRFPIVAHQDWTADEGVAASSGGSSSGGSSKLPERICASLSDCRKYCICPAGHIDDLPAGKGMASPNELFAIPQNQPGITGTGLLKKEAINALLKAGKIAQAKSGGPYTIRILNTYRPLADQVTIACGAICSDNPKINAKLGKTIAFPGGSLHGSGVAMDIALFKGDKALTTINTKLETQEKESTKENTELLQSIMTEAGWYRYCVEVWHFEVGTAEAAYRSQNCPWPPTKI